jgi:hypothetical protein
MADLGVGDPVNIDADGWQDLVRERLARDGHVVYESQRRLAEYTGLAQSAVDSMNAHLIERGVPNRPDALLTLDQPSDWVTCPPNRTAHWGFAHRDVIYCKTPGVKNTRAPGFAQTNGMGWMTSRRDLPGQQALQESLRELFEVAYGHDNLRMQLERFGYKVGGSGKMITHLDMCPKTWWETQREVPPTVHHRSSDDPQAYGPRQRVQGLFTLSAPPTAGWGRICLRNDQADIAVHSDDGFATLCAISGVNINTPKTKGPFAVKRVNPQEGVSFIEKNIPLAAGQGVIWYCGIPHFNTATPKRSVARVVQYINYSVDVDGLGAVADRVNGLGLQHA